MRDPKSTFDCTDSCARSLIHADVQMLRKHLKWLKVESVIVVCLLLKHKLVKKGQWRNASSVIPDCRQSMRSNDRRPIKWRKASFVNWLHSHIIKVSRCFRFENAKSEMVFCLQKDKLRHRSLPRWENALQVIVRWLHLFIDKFFKPCKWLNAWSVIADWLHSSITKSCKYFKWLKAWSVIDRWLHLDMFKRIKLPKWRKASSVIEDWLHPDMSKYFSECKRLKALYVSVDCERSRIIKERKELRYCNASSGIVVEQI